MQSMEHDGKLDVVLECIYAERDALIKRVAILRERRERAENATLWKTEEWQRYKDANVKSAHALQLAEHKVNQSSVQVKVQGDMLGSKRAAAVELQEKIEIEKVKASEELSNFYNSVETMSERMKSLASAHDDRYLQLGISDSELACVESDACTNRAMTECAIFNETLEQLQSQSGPPFEIAVDIQRMMLKGFDAEKHDAEQLLSARLQRLLELNVLLEQQKSHIQQLDEQLTSVLQKADQQPLENNHFQQQQQHQQRYGLQRCREQEQQLKEYHQDQQQHSLQY